MRTKKQKKTLIVHKSNQTQLQYEQKNSTHNNKNNNKKRKKLIKYTKTLIIAPG